MEAFLNLRLPVGYRFDPTDDDMVEWYLMRKILSQPLPVDVVPELDVFQAEPWMLPKGDDKIFTERQYYFFNTRGLDLESQDRRVAGNGQWRVSERANVLIPGNNRVMGKKNTLIFWEERGAAAAKKTKWVMHEFRLVTSTSPPRIAHLAMYRVFEKKGGRKVRRGPRGRGARNAALGGRNSGDAEVIDLNEESGSFSGPPPMTPSVSEASESG